MYKQQEILGTAGYMGAALQTEESARQASPPSNDCALSPWSPAAGCMQHFTPKQQQEPAARAQLHCPSGKTGIALHMLGWNSMLHAARSHARACPSRVLKGGP